MMRILTGHLEFVPHDGYYLILDNGDFEIVRFEEKATPPPINEPLELRVDDEQFVVGWNFPPSQGLLAQPDKVPDNVVRLGVFRFTGTTTDDEQMVVEQRKADAAATEIETYYKFFSKGRLDIQVRGYAVKYDGYCTPPLYAKDAIDQFISDNNIDFPFTHYHGWCGKQTRNVCGLATLGGNRGATYPLYACGVRTIIHEFGHNLGLLHCGISEIDGSEREYGDVTSVMGSSQIKTEGHVSWHIVQKKWHHEDRNLLVTNNCQVLLEPIEMPLLACRLGTYQHVMVGDYMLSTRKAAGTRYPQQYAERLYIHRVENGNATKLMEPVLKPSESRLFANGPTITFLDYQNEIAKVEIRFENGQIQELAIPSGWPPAPDNTTVERIHTGAWYDPTYEGQGFNIVVKDDVVCLFWYTYDEKGWPIYYVGTGVIVDGKSHCTISVTSNGTFNDPTQRTEKIVGAAQLYFTAYDRGVVQWDLPGIYDRGVMAIQPVVTASSALCAAWWDPSKVGSGFNFLFFGNTCAGYWYTFDHQKKQRWYVLLGSKDEVGVYHLTIYEYFKGYFMYPDRPTENKAGTARLVVVNDDLIKIEYDLQATGLVGTGSQVLSAKF